MPHRDLMSIKGMAAPPCHGEPGHHHPLLHGEHNFPTTSLPPIWTSALPKRHAEDDTYLETLSQALNLALRLYRPDLILYQAGVDVHQADELGYLSLSDAGVHQRDAMVFDCAISNGLPIAAVPGGGYRRDWRQLLPLHLSCSKRRKALWLAPSPRQPPDNNKAARGRLFLI